MPFKRVSWVLALVLLGYVFTAGATNLPANSDNDPPLLIRPVNAPIEQGFGPAYNTVIQRRQMNLGLTFGITGQKSVMATAKGIVKAIECLSSGCIMTIEHAKGYQSLYENVNQPSVAPGDYVEQGDIIGEVGSVSKAGSLYYEFHLHGNALDPTPFFEAPSPTSTSNIGAC